jgi:hypothetical protein
MGDYPHPTIVLDQAARPVPLRSFVDTTAVADDLTAPPPPEIRCHTSGGARPTDEIRPYDSGRRPQRRQP